ncbi:outer membrane transport energization protein TonB [Marinomonas polaris DSM 16579]|uniref:Protein TonB n=1 Tax=Marinomonas polaris DSM 16579 TaxID=1122206 RepID=A0A1M5HAT4_9GAMM|nr:energy transducer TonB [Marinomonas polaris]SHG13033.1 outer membrane transport energization protein TonB [Marinomonas polaris DSM 16579]
MIPKRHWIIAGGLAISVHAGAFYAVFYAPTVGSQSAGSQGIEFDLGMVGDLGAAAQTTAAQEEVKEVEETVEEPIEEVQEEVEPEVEPEPEPIIEPEPVVEPEIIKEPEPVEVKQESPIEVKKPEPKPEPKPKPKPKPEPEPEPKKEEPVVKAAPKQVAPQSMANQKATTGSSNSATSGGNPGAKANYFTQLKSVLGQNKRYPRASRRRNEEGVVSLSFVAHADGSVSDVKITESSGHKRLDDAVLDMIKRSTPLPKFSKDMSETELRINLPVSFKLSDLM